MVKDILCLSYHRERENKIIINNTKKWVHLHRYITILYSLPNIEIQFLLIIRPVVFSFFRNIAEKYNATIIAANGVEDHVHILLKDM